MKPHPSNPMNLLQKRLKQIGFVESPLSRSEFFRALITCASARTLHYAFIKDERKTGNNLDFILYNAPVDFPGEGLDKLGVGVKILLYECYDFHEKETEEVYLKYGHVLKSLGPQMAGATEEELDKPIFKTQRFRILMLEKKFYQQFKESKGEFIERLKSSPSFLEMMKGNQKQMNEVINRIKPEITELCTAFAKSNPEAQSFSPEIYGFILAKELYLEALLAKASPAK